MWSVAYTALPALTFDIAMNPTDFFIAAIERAAQVTLVDLRATEINLPDVVRDRAVHVLSFALGLPSIWPLTRDLLLALAPWLEIQGVDSAWMGVLKRGVVLAQSQGDVNASARLHLHLGRLYLLKGNYSDSAAQLQRGATIAELLNDAPTLAACLHRLAWLAVQRSQLPEAERLAHKVLETLAANEPGAEFCYTVLGRVALYRGEWEIAIAHYQRSLNGRREQGGPAHIAPGLRDLGNALMMSKRYPEASAVMQEAIELFGQIGSVYEQAVVRMNLGIIHWYQGEHDAALACYDASEPVFRRLGVVASLGRLYSNRGLALRDLRRFEEAECTLVEAIELLRAADAVIEVANTLESLSSLFLLLDQREQAITLLHEALRQLDRLPEKPAHVYGLIVERLRAIEG